jgi:hypothetical protein
MEAILMNQYRVVYRCKDGYTGEKIVYAANRIMAFEVFANIGIKDVIAADCFRILE